MEIILLVLFIVAFIWFFSRSNKSETTKTIISKPVSKNIPEAVLEKYFDEVVDEFVSGEMANRFQTNLILKRGEHLVFDIPEIQLCEERTVKVKGGYQGFSVRIMKGLSYRFGGFEGGSEQQVVPIDEGRLIFTNKRLVFSGERYSKDMPFSKLNTVTPLDNGIVIGVSGKQKREYYIGTDTLEIKLTIIPDSEENFQEETITWRLSGEEVRQMVQKLVAQKP